MRALLIVVCAIALTGCRKDPATPRPTDAAPGAAEGGAPSASPIQTRDRLVRDLAAQQAAAREREAQLESLLDHDR